MLDKFRYICESDEVVLFEKVKRGKEETKKGKRKRKEKKEMEIKNDEKK